MTWLEVLGPPEILARKHHEASRYTIFVPNNSLDGAVSTKTSKAVSPKLLDGHSPGDPDVVYRWRIADEDSARVHVRVLDQLASRLRALGWGIDFAAAAADLVEDGPNIDGLELLVPGTKGGVPTRVPTSGLLAHLDECHRAFVGRLSAKGINPSTKPMRFGQTRYGRAGAWRPGRHVAFEMEAPSGGPFASRWDQTQTVAAWLRRASSQALLQEELSESWIDSFVLGHVQAGDRGYRVSFLPLPSIGHRNSDGGVRRVLIVEPPGVTGTDGEALDLLRIKLPGLALVEEGTRAARAVLVNVADRSKVLPFYIGEGRVWETVTPVVLHGHNTARGEISLGKTDRLLRQAFVSAGIPDSLIATISFQRAPYWAGCEAATEIRVPRHLGNWPRVHVHVEFAESVSGPIFVGIGRHYGIGVFARR
jgi:CRISPR-associated protein Csb2